MSFEDQAPGADPTTAATGSTDPGPRPRRRTTRSWSTPLPAQRFDRPGADEGPEAPEVSSTAAAPTPATSPRALRTSSFTPPPPPGASDLGPVNTLLRELNTELGQLRSVVATLAATQDGSAVTGPELAASIEALGSSLGSGMATLLTEHRNLLARDIEGAADRILEELAQRMRTSGTQTADAVEERVRHLSTRGLAELSEQLELRLDQMQSDITGLRAVMLEIPDQTALADRLERLTEVVGKGKDAGRLSPAMVAAIEKGLAGPVERLANASSVDAEVLEALTGEMTALRRRISLRSEAKAEGVELTDDQLEDLADRIAARLQGGEPPARRSPVRAAAAVEDEEDDGSLDDWLDELPVEDEPAPARPAKRTAKRAAPKKAPAKKAAAATKPAATKSTAAKRTARRRA